MTQAGTFLLAWRCWWASMWAVRACGWSRWCRHPDSPGYSLWVAGGAETAAPTRALPASPVTLGAGWSLPRGPRGQSGPQPCVLLQV